MDRTAQVNWINQLAADTFDNCHVTLEDYTEHDYTVEDYIQDLKGEAEADLRAQPWYTDHDENLLYAALKRLVKGD